MGRPGTLYYLNHDLSTLIFFVLPVCHTSRTRTKVAGRFFHYTETPTAPIITLLEELKWPLLL